MQQIDRYLQYTKNAYTMYISFGLSFIFLSESYV